MKGVGFDLIGPLLNPTDCMFNLFSSLWQRSFCVEIRFTWICSMLAATLVILSGIFPVLFIPVETGTALRGKDGMKRLNLLLSFAVGSLLGDVFLHLLPESWQSGDLNSVGLWTLAGMLSCFMVEKLFSSSTESQHRVTAWMNLVANLVDNFTHGLAVGGSFLVNLRFGLLTTFAILVHEIPHEIGDFAILLRAEFDRWTAVKAQLLTSVGGMIGATVALACSGSSGAQATTSWILPFTAGGFLNIALVQVLPELLQETNPVESLKQSGLMLCGMGIMGVINLIAV